MLRRRLTNPAPTDDQPDFPGFAEMRSEGITDYVALVTRFAARWDWRDGCDLLDLDFGLRGGVFRRRYRPATAAGSSTCRSPEVQIAGAYSGYTR